jgi:hypothetical protein
MAIYSYFLLPFHVQVIASILAVLTILFVGLFFLPGVAFRIRISVLVGRLRKLKQGNKRDPEDLFASIDWVSRRLGDGLGYDVKSFEDTQTPRYIEVKTTNGPALTPLLVSQTELEFSQEQDTEFWLYRGFDFRALPRLFVLHGALDRHVSLTPTDYRARLRAAK